VLLDGHMGSRENRMSWREDVVEGECREGRMSWREDIVEGGCRGGRISWREDVPHALDI
jgi:hypothetical protein